jgi:hypothetical protein
MDPVALRVTMDNYLPGEGDRLSAICRKHADRMSMPRDWVIDDRRTNNPTLFKVQQSPKPARREEPSVTRRRARPFPKPESFDTLSLVRPSEQPVVEAPIVEAPIVAAPVEREPEVVATPVEEPAIQPAAVESAQEPDALEPTQAMPWRPRFDHEDDLDGVMKPKGRLLSRAFGSDETQFMQRPKQSKELDREPFGEHDIP